MEKGTKFCLRCCSVALLGGIIIIVGRIFQILGSGIFFNVLAMCGGLTFAKVIIEKITKEEF